MYATAVQRQFIGYSTTIHRLFSDNLAAIQRQLNGCSTTIQRQHSTAVMRRSFLCAMVSATAF